MTARRPRTAALLFVLAALAVGVAGRVRRAAARADGVPLSPLTGGRYVGADWPERVGVATGRSVAGEMDDLADYARPGFDPAAVHPAVRRFYEHTADYDLLARTRWHPGFRLGAALATRLTARLEQLALPGPFGGDRRRLVGRFVAVDPAADPRDGVRAWVRTDADTGAAVFVALYGSHVRDGERLVNVAVPLPGASLSTVLRVRAFDGTADGAGLELTSRGAGDPGLYLATPVGPVALPVAQRFRVWPPDAPDAPAVETPAVGNPGPTVENPDPAVVATHEMWLFGRQFLTVRYAAVRE